MSTSIAPSEDRRTQILNEYKKKMKEHRELEAKVKESKEILNCQ